MKDCCYKNLDTPKRIGRANYVCPECGEDISMAVIFYEDAKFNDK